MSVDVRKYTGDVRRYLEAALGTLSPSGARDLARSLIEQAQGLSGQNPGRVAEQVAGQVREVAQGLLEWSQQSRDRVVELVQREVGRQLRALGIATRDDVDALRKRVRDLEKGSGAKPAARTTTARKTSSRKTSSRKTPARKTPARKTAAKRSSASSRA
jgi:polyhydroxyalkanoate synthesis regulator phasin